MTFQPFECVAKSILRNKELRLGSLTDAEALLMRAEGDQARSKRYRFGVDAVTMNNIRDDLFGQIAIDCGSLRGPPNKLADEIPVRISGRNVGKTFFAETVAKMGVPAELMGFGASADLAKKQAPEPGGVRVREIWVDGVNVPVNSCQWPRGDEEPPWFDFELTVP